MLLLRMPDFHWFFRCDQTLSARAPRALICCYFFGHNTYVLPSCATIAGSSAEQVSRALHDLRQTSWYDQLRADDHVLVETAFLVSTA